MQVSSERLNQQLNQYFDYLRNVKKASGNTLLAYKRDLEKFYGFAELHGIESFVGLSVEDVKSYKQYLSSSGLSSASVSRSLSSLRGLFQYLISVGVVEENPARSVHNDKLVKKDMSILTASEIESILAQPDTHDLKGIRDKAMLELLYATGLKVSELVSLDVSDLNFTLSFVRCGSSPNERYVPFYPIASKALSDYLSKARKFFIVNDLETALFVNMSGERITRQGFWKLLKGYVASAGISKDITPHTLRHSFAAHLLENGADIHDIQEILGHRDPASTQRYAQYLKEKMRSSYMKFHPRALE